MGQHPRRFGVAVTDANGQIERLVEKPQEFVSDEAIVGIYYIKDVKELKKALQHLIGNDIRTRGEFQLTDALQMMIEQGCKFRTAPVKEWLDCGLPETLIQTNTWLLQNRPHLNNICHVVSQNKSMNNVKLIPPCNIGRNVIIGDNSVIKNANIQNCVIWNNEEVHSSQISGQVIARC